MKSYYRKCKHCGQRIQLRQMPGGQWVAFEGYDQVHKCTSQATHTRSLAKATPTVVDPKRIQLEQILEREQQLGFQDNAVAGGIEACVSEWARPYEVLHPDLSYRINAVKSVLAGYSIVSKEQRRNMILEALSILKGKPVQGGDARLVSKVATSPVAQSRPVPRAQRSSSSAASETLRALAGLVLGSLVLISLGFFLVILFNYPRPAPSQSSNTSQTTTDKYNAIPPIQSPSSTPIPQYSAVSNAAKSFPATPTPYLMWVCTDLAYGYEQDSQLSHVVWQMSLQDLWTVQVLDQVGNWYKVESGGLTAFMPANTLCKSKPAALPPTPIPIPARVTGCPNGCTVPPPGCNIKGNVSYDTGEKIYHVPGGKYYNSTVINPAYGERWFCTEDEAKANGWRKSTQ